MIYRKIADFTSVVTGGTPSTKVKDYWESGNIPWLQSGCCQNCDVNKADKFITQKGYDNSSAKLMPSNTVMIALTGATAGKIGYLNFEACGNQSITGILPCDTINQRYLYYYLLSLRNKILSDCVGGAQPHISQEYVKNIQIPVMDLSEQEKIAKIFLELENLIRTRKKELQTLDDLIKARFVEMFGDPIINSMNLKTRDLKDVLILKAGDFTAASDIADEPSEANPYPCYGGNGIRGYVAEYNQEGGYSLIGRQGALSGNVQYASGKFKNTEHALLVTPIDEMNSIWLNQLLLNLDLKRYQTGAAQPGLSVTNLQEIQILCVPLNEQDQFADFVKQVNKSKVAVQKSLNLYQDLFDKLMNDYFGD